MPIKSNAGLIQKAAQAQSAAAVANSNNQHLKPIDRLKNILNAESVQEQFRNALKENSGAFIASLIDLYNNDKTLQACDPKNVVMEALKAASLKLPINKQLGFSYIVPYKNKDGYIPTFQIGYKGYIQLAMRTGAYKHINADIVYEGELVSIDKLSGEIVLDPSKRISDKKIGYFAYIETINGFRKTLFKTVDEIIAHAQKYSRSYGNQYSAWATDFDAMALKTCMRLLISKYGIMSIELMQALSTDEPEINSQGNRTFANESAIEADYSIEDAKEEHTDDALKHSGSLLDEEAVISGEQ